ncbi:MAG: hypothetical protein V4850_29415 [Myxococcota bacterium]
MTRLLLLAVPLLAGCLSCTDMACVGMLAITFDGELPDGAEVTVLLDGEPVACDGEQCELREDGFGLVVILFGSDEPEVVVRITTAGADEDHPVSPTWDAPYFPNGEVCDGKDGGCLGGEATLAV